MGLGSCTKYLFITLLELAIIFLLIVYIPFLPPDAKIATPYSVIYPEKLTGKLTLNQKLNNVKLWHENEVYGPEAFADYNGELYTSLSTGHIVKLTGNHITPIVTFGKPCKGEYEAAICGRPLGLYFDSVGNLYAADAYYGIFKVNVRTGTTEMIVSMDRLIGGKKSKLINSLVVADNNDIYFTDSSTEFALHDGLFDMLADGSGRLIKYDAKMKSTTVLIDNLHFANGIAFSRNKDLVIVAETARNRIHRYYIAGPKANTRDIFIDLLPGMPDNLKADGQGGFLVPLVVAADNDNPCIGQLLGPWPEVRRLIARLFGVSESIFIKINQIYPNEICAKAAYMIGHFASTNFLLPSRVTILHISDDGKILDSLHADNKKIAGISETHIFKDTLYLGSPFNPYIGTIPLKDIGWSNLQPQVPTAKTTPKPAPTTKEPTTTTTTTPTTTTPTTTQKPTTTTPTTTAQHTTTTSPTTTPKPTATTTTPTTTPMPTTTTTTPTTTPQPTTTTTTPTTTPQPTTTTTTPTTTPQPTTTTTTPTTTPQPTTTTTTPTTTPQPTTTSAPKLSTTTAAPKATQNPTDSTTTPKAKTAATPAPAAASTGTTATPKAA